MSQTPSSTSPKLSSASTKFKSTTGRFNFVHTTVRPVLRGLSRMAPETASSLAHRIFLTPPRLGSPMRETWWATEAEAFEIPFATGKLAGWRWGWSGPKVLLMHGWAGRGLQLGAFAQPLVAAGYQVIAFDAPGHGRSWGSRSSLPAMADAVTAMVRHLDGVVGIVAHSLGAAATSVALGRPGTPLAIDRLVYISPAVDLFGVTSRFAELTGFSDDVMARMRSRIERRYGFEWSDFQGLGIAPAMRQPLLVVHDREDREVPWRDGQTLVRSWPRARLVTTQGLGHHRILRDAGVTAVASEFLSSDGREASTKST